MLFYLNVHAIVDPQLTKGKGVPLLPPLSDTRILLWPLLMDSLAFVTDLLC